MNRVRALAIAMSLSLVAGMCLATDWAAAAGSPAASPEKGVLSVGSISPTPRQETAKFQPFVDYLARHVAAAGITQGRVVVAGSITEMAGLMKKGEVDLYIDSPFPVAVVNIRSGAHPFLRRWKGGKGEYRSVIFARKESGIQTARDLLGKMVAFEEPSSTSGYLLPKATLLEAGMTLVEYKNPWTKVPPNEIGYVFTDAEEKVMAWVLQERVPAGALSQDNVAKFAKERKDDLKIVLQTVDVPRHVIAHRADLPAKLVAMLEEALLGMDRNDEGKRVLEGFEKTSKFDKFPQGATQAFRPIEALARQIEKEVGK